MVYLRKRGNDSDTSSKRDSDDSGSAPNKRTKRSVKPNDSPGDEGPASSNNPTRTPPSASNQKASKEHTDTPIPQLETPAKRQSLRSSHLLVTPTPEVMSPRRLRRVPTDLTDNKPEVGTPTRRSRRLSTDTNDNPPQAQTPVRRSRRLSADLTENPPQVQTPTRRSRRLSTDLTENPPLVQTPTRWSRRLSTDLTENPPLVQTPTRRSRRLSENPPESDTGTKRTRRLSTDVSDSSSNDQTQIPLSPKSSVKETQNAPDAPKPTSQLHVEVLTSHPKLLASDLGKSAPKVQTLTRRSRRLSSDLADIPEDDQKRAESETPARKSRRSSGKNLHESESVSEKPLFVVEEMEEEKDEGDSVMSNSVTGSLAVKVAKEKEKETELEIIEEEDEITESGLNVEDGGKKQPISDIEVIEVCSDIEEKDDIEILPLKQVEKEAEKSIEDEEEDVKLVMEEASPVSEVKGKNAKVLEKNYDPETAQENKEPLGDRKSVSKDRAAMEDFESEKSVDSTTEGEVLLDRPETCSNAKKENRQNVESVAGSNVRVTDIKDKETLENQENQPVADTKDKKPPINTITQPKSHNNNVGEVSAVRGKLVSGRWWKKENKRFTSIMKDQGVKSSWAIKMQRKQELKDMLAMKTSIAEEKKRKKAELRERQKLNAIRREENARKSEIVQVIKDSRKIKKMKRKQLRYIETRDTTQLKKT